MCGGGTVVIGFSGTCSLQSSVDTAHKSLNARRTARIGHIVLFLYCWCASCRSNCEMMDFHPQGGSLGSLRQRACEDVSSAASLSCLALLHRRRRELLSPLLLPVSVLQPGLAGTAFTI